MNPWRMVRRWWAGLVAALRRRRRNDQDAQDKSEPRRTVYPLW